MKPYQFKTLRARLTALMISPVVIILLVAGAFSFIHARNIMLDQWNQSMMLQLERAAHEIEMQLSKPLELMEMFSKSGSDTPDEGLLEAIVLKLKTLPSVVRVNLGWHTAGNDIQQHRGRYSEHSNGRFMRFHRGAFTKIAPPVVDQTTGKQTVSMTMVLTDTYDTPVGNLEIVLGFDDLVTDISANVWWQNAQACIANRASGEMVLTSGLMKGRSRLGENGDLLEQALKKEISEKTAGTLWGQGQPPERVAGFHSLETFPWALVVFAEGRTILAPIINFRNGFILGATLLILVIYGIIRLNVDRMSGTIRRLSNQAEMLVAGDYGDKIPSPSHDEIGRLADSFNTMVDGLKERDTIRNNFGLYVNPDFARVLLKQPEAGSLGGKRKKVAILMADICGFTPLTEKMSPETIIDVLNRYFSVIIPLVSKHKGIIVDFVGDGILAFFEPVDEPLAATVKRCVQAAIAMQDAMVLLNRQMVTHGLPEINMGVGIHCGPVVVGNIGSETRKKYGIVGACVNITQRIQAQSEAGEVVVSEAVYTKIKSEVAVRRSLSTTLKGVASAVHLYALAPKKE